MELFASLARLARSLPISPAEAERLHAHHRQEKLAVRRRLVAAFQALDRLRDGPASGDSE